MDPISIAAGIAGIVQSTAWIAKSLKHFISNATDAPEAAEGLLKEVVETNAICSQLQHFLDRLDAGANASQLQVQHLVIVFSGCIATLSNLESALEPVLRHGRSAQQRIRYMWSRAELSTLSSRLQQHKLSLSLILGAYHAETLLDVRNIIQRIEANTQRTEYAQMAARLYELPESMSTSSGPTQRVLDGENEPKEEPQQQGHTWDFEDVLLASFPYRRARDSQATDQFSTDEARSVGTSYLDGVSMAQVSNLSLINLVITISEIHNARHYVAETRQLNSGTRQRTRRKRATQAALLAQALDSANRAVVFDIDKSYEQAMASYREACNTLYNVQVRTKREDDKKKLEAIVSSAKRASDAG